MKQLTLILTCVLLLTVPAAADNWLENGDFADGIDHWHGDGEAPADFKPEDPFAKPDPMFSKGMIIPLKHLDWTKVAQDFRGKLASGILTITYMVSPDFTFSTKPDDYLNMPDKIGYDAWRAFNTPPGAWIIFISDFGSSHGTYTEVMPRGPAGKVQGYRMMLHGLTPMEDKTITLAFPPGTGNIIILSVQLVDK